MSGQSRRQGWLWFSTTTVTVLATVTLLLLSLPWLLRTNDPLFEMHPGRVTPALLELVLLFNCFAVYRQWQLRRERRGLIVGDTKSAESPQQFAEPSELDPVTGLYTRGSAAERLATELVRSRRAREPLTLLVLDLNDFGSLNESHGRESGNEVLKEFAWCLKRASRGSDLLARLGPDEFLLVLPGCGVSAAQRVLARLSPVQLSCGKDKITLTCSGSVIEYQSGETPADLLRHADMVLQLYRKASRDAVSVVARN